MRVKEKTKTARCRSEKKKPNDDHCVARCPTCYSCTRDGNFDSNEPNTTKSCDVARVTQKRKIKRTFKNDNVKHVNQLGILDLSFADLFNSCLFVVFLCAQCKRISQPVVTNIASSKYRWRLT